MRKLIFVLIVLFVFPIGWVYADSVTLDNSETVQSPVAVKLDWEIVKINAKTKHMVVKYRWRDATDKAIWTSNNLDKYWACQDRDAQLAVNCIDVGNPYPGCTGLGTGENLDPGDTCFTDVFSFSIRSQDVGTSIGVGLRTLIWNQMKGDILTPGNDGSFD